LEKLIINYNKNVDTSSGDRQIILAKVDVDKFGELSSRYNVKAVPTGECLKD
jgi:thioredoxin-like negative regulator of GroEL